MKKFLALLLVICILTAALPVQAKAAPQSNTLVRQINQCYQKTLELTGEPDMSNLCGTFVGYQLYLLGITTSPVLANGYEFYYMYSRQAVTSGGYGVNLYPGSKYTIEQALNAITHNGTRDAYNIMLCFDWTTSGGGYGHVMFIHGIIDGTVYAVDNFTTDMAGPEGNPMIGSIADFAEEYRGWSSFAGAVEFGTKEYASLCTSYPTDMFIQTTAPALLLTQPSQPDTNDARIVRNVMSGERLAVTDLLVDAQGVRYYRVREQDTDYYMLSANTQPVWLKEEGLQTRNFSMRTTQQIGDQGVLAGEVLSTGSTIGALELIVTNRSGVQVARSTYQEPRFNQNVSDLLPNFSHFGRGVYIVRLYATLLNYYDNGNAVTSKTRRVCVFEDTLLVGDVQEPKEVIAESAELKQGWLYENGIWRCYRNGVPRTGWYCCDGVDYYLKDDGAVTTGWANINGEDRYFTETGAMRTGWLTEGGKTRYMLFNGVSAKGWREIDGTNYYFDENGILDEKAIG